MKHQLFFIRSLSILIISSILFLGCAFGGALISFFFKESPFKEAKGDPVSELLQYDDDAFICIKTHGEIGLNGNGCRVFLWDESQARVRKVDIFDMGAKTTLSLLHRRNICSSLVRIYHGFAVNSKKYTCLMSERDGKGLKWSVIIDVEGTFFEKLPVSPLQVSLVKDKIERECDSTTNEYHT